jgi:hypothetical protein
LRREDEVEEVTLREVKAARLVLAPSLARVKRERIL